MKSKLTILSLTLLILTLLATTTAALADSGYQIPWWTIDGGGGTSHSQDGAYTLRGITGQPDTGPASGGSFSLQAGFWVERLIAWLDQHFTYLPLVFR